MLVVRLIVDQIAYLFVVELQTYPLFVELFQIAHLNLYLLEDLYD